MAAVVDQADVYMGTVACLISIGFGYEDGFEAMRECHTLDQTLEEYGAVAGRQDTITVNQVDLKLTGRTLLERGIQRQILDLCCLLDVFQKVGVLIQLVD